MTTRKFTYIPSNTNNKIERYIPKLIGTPQEFYTSQTINDDIKLILNNGCIYIPNYYCKKNDKTTFQKLKNDVQKQNPIDWSKHMKYENPEFSETFNSIVKKISEEFKIDITQSRLNYYRNGHDWKPWHHDSHAYGNKEENYTLGVSFGESRMMDFVKHNCDENDNNNPSLDQKFSFPQHNGDLFGFNKEVNQKFMHGIPKEPSKIGDRFSVIIWGKKL